MEMVVVQYKIGLMKKGAQAPQGIVLRALQGGAARQMQSALAEKQKAARSGPLCLKPWMNTD
jgi:hypothetical protein